MPYAGRTATVNTTDDNKVAEGHSSNTTLTTVGSEPCGQPLMDLFLLLLFQPLLIQGKHDQCQSIRRLFSLCVSEVLPASSYPVQGKHDQRQSIRRLFSLSVSEVLHLVVLQCSVGSRPLSPKPKLKLRTLFVGVGCRRRLRWLKAVGSHVSHSSAAD